MSAGTDQHDNDEGNDNDYDDEPANEEDEEEGITRVVMESEAVQILKLKLELAFVQRRERWH